MKHNYSELETAYSISQISEITGVPQTTIRSWEQSLEEAFPVSRDPQKNRFYTARHIQLIKEINRFREEDLSLPAIKKLLLMARERDQEWDERQDDINYNTNRESESESNALSVVERSIDPVDKSMAILQQIQEQQESFDYRVSQFFNTLSSMLEDQKSFVTTEINRAVAELEGKHDSASENIETRIQQQLANNEEQLHLKLEQMIKEVNATDQEKIADTIKKGLSDWALISREELESRKDQRGFFSRLFNR
ncbi:helix-turn-helix domain-containing protein [Paenibacillus sp. FSL P4-0288]|uniref:helix-turn-helix domain-containing protein n=1 Tax=Paenibacillus sp. FSL P4-0288 TaxID=2921633 RepID=UPI0030F68FF8